MEINLANSHQALHMYRSHMNGATKSMDRLASGSKQMVTDDAGGLAVSSKFEAQTSRVESARTNITNSLSKVQTAEGYLDKVTDALHRMSEVAALAMDNTKSATDRATYNTEFQDLKAYIRDVTNRTMNGQSLFDGSSQSVIKDESGNFYSYNNADLTGSNITNLTTGNVTSVDQWETSVNLWKVSIPGYTLNQTSYKTTQSGYQVSNASNNIWRTKQDLWYNAATDSWATTNNGGTKYDSGSFIKLGTGSGSVNIQSAPDSWDVEYIYAGSKYLTTANPLSKGNLEAADVSSVASGTFITYDPSSSSDEPTYTTFAQGTFFANDPGLGASQTAVSAGDYVTVDPVTEDNAEVYYAAGSTVDTDPTGADSGATELANAHVLTSTGAKTVVSLIKTALDQITSDRASIGAVSGRLRRMNEQMSMLKESLAQSVGRMKDADVASESTQFARHQILLKSSVDMIDKARILNENAFRLLVNY